MYVLCLYQLVFEMPAPGTGSWFIFCLIRFVCIVLFILVCVGNTRCKNGFLNTLLSNRVRNPYPKNKCLCIALFKLVSV